MVWPLRHAGTELASGGGFLTFLPIAERELRVAARRKGTYFLRIWTTVAAFVVSFLFLFIATLSGGYLPNLGRTLFQILTCYAFGLCLLAGVLLAADCISEEKRKGTLGLLFLTDLKGYDVVSGKLLAVGLNALYGLLAVLPITALPLLIGGVTGGEFWRMALALINTLFFSLSVGLWVSTRARETLRAMSQTLAWLVAAVVVLPMLGRIISYFRLPLGWWYATMFSPLHPFNLSIGTAPAKYWYSLLASQAFAWLVFAAACWSLPRAWQDRPFKSRRRAPAVPTSPSPAAPRISPASIRLGELDPIVWLMCREGTLRVWIWILAVAGALIVLATAAFDNAVLSIGFLANSPAHIFGFLLKILLAIQATRFFADARRSGALELLLATPLGGSDIVKGQWQGLRKLFLWPVCVFMAAQLFAFGLQVWAVDFGSGNWPMELLAMLPGFPYFILKFLVDLLAVGWLGMWLGLSAKKPSLAPAMTVLFGLVLPSFAFCIPDVTIDAVIIFWTRGKLTGDFRRAALPEYEPVRPGIAFARGIPP